MKELSFFTYYFFTIVGYLLVYSVGHILHSLFIPSTTTSLYTSLKKNIIGFITILCIYSIYKTNFHTINIGWIIIGIVLLLKNKINFNYTFFKTSWNKIEYKYLCWQIFVLSVLFIHSFYLCKSFTTNNYYLPFANIYKDPYYYTCIINNLVKIGIENQFYDQTIQINQSNVSLYHYGELWFTAFFVNIFKLRTLYVLSLISFSIYSTYCVLASMTLIQLLFSKINKIALVVAPLLLVIGGISFFYPTFTFIDATNVDTGMFIMPKYPMLCLFILIQFIFIYKNNYLLFVLAVLSTLMVYTGLIVPFGLAVLSILILLWYIKEVIFSQIIEFGIITSVFLFFTIGLIFLLNKEPTIIIIDNNLFNLKSVFSLDKFIFLLKFCIAYSIKFFLSLLIPLSILCLYIFISKHKLVFNKKNTLLFIYILFLLFSAILCCGVFLKLTDSFQFRTNIYTTVSALVVFIIIQYLILQQQKISFLFATLLIILSIYQTKPHVRINSSFDNVFVRNVSMIYKGENVGRFIDNDKSHVNILVYFPMEYMLHFTDDFYPIIINVFDEKKQENEYMIEANKIIISRTSFYKYYFKSIDKDSSKSIEQIEVDFIKKYNIKYLVYENKTQIPIEIRNNIKLTYLNNNDNVFFSVLK